MKNNNIAYAVHRKYYDKTTDIWDIWTVDEFKRYNDYHEKHVYYNNWIDDDYSLISSIEDYEKSNLYFLDDNLYEKMRKIINTPITKKQEYILICNLGYISSTEKELNGKTSSSIIELVNLAKKYIDSANIFFEQENITFKNFKITDKSFNEDNTSYIIKLEDSESSIYIRRAEEVEK
jgi:hypothetical protein